MACTNLCFFVFFFLYFTMRTCTMHMFPCVIDFAHIEKSLLKYHCTKLIIIFCSSWMRLGFLVDVKGRVPVKVVARTFASGKTEKMVYQCLADLGLPSGKNDTMERDDFTFDKFYALYHKICPRNDIEELFRSV